MKKLHLGCGGSTIDGWENHDTDVDIRKPLPYPDNSVDFIFTEHVVEHLFQREAWDFFEECHRILKPGGVVRTTVPSIVKLHQKITDNYIKFIQTNGWGDGSRKSGIRHVVFNHGHQSLWTEELLAAMLSEIGFIASPENLHISSFSELRNVEQHWRSAGLENADVESIAVEGIKK